MAAATPIGLKGCAAPCFGVTPNCPPQPAEWLTRLTSLTHAGVLRWITIRYYFCNTEGATIVVKEEGRDAVQTVVSATGPALWHAPLTVLVDGDTASAAEILAGVTSSITARHHKNLVPYHPGSCNRVLVQLQHRHVCLP